MHRILPDMALVGLPTGLTSAERNFYASSFDELLELMTSMLVFASIRKTGRLPSLRSVTGEWTTAVALANTPSVELPSALRFDEGFVKRMLGVWDDHTARDPDVASTYLSVTRNEYVMGIGASTLVGSLASGDGLSVDREICAGERVISVSHGTR